MMAQVPAPQHEQAQQQEPLKQEPALTDPALTPQLALTQQPTARTTVTGSHIKRVRKEEPSLPLLLLDRSYIDQSGTTTTSELIRTVPQAQNFRAPALPRSSW
jgi:hypothetical protein